MKPINLETLQNVLQGVEVKVVEAGGDELRLILADGDKITIKATPSYDEALAPQLHFYVGSH
jgi:hypothetical protein